MVFLTYYIIVLPWESEENIPNSKKGFELLMEGAKNNLNRKAEKIKVLLWSGFKKKIVCICI